MREVYNTEHVDRVDAFEYVRDALANSSAPLAVTGGRPVVIRANSLFAEFEAVTVTVVRSVSDTGFALRRTSAMIRRSDPEAFRLVMAPQCRLRHDPHAQLLNLQGRDLALYDTSREFESWRRPGLQTSWLVVITVPRVLIDVPAQRVGSLMGKALPRGLYLHPIAGRLLTAIGTRPGSFESLCPQTVGQTLAGLVEGLIADGLGLPVPTDVADRARVLLAQAAIVEHAHDPEFTAAGIARQLHESGRTLRDSARRCNTRLQRLLTEHRVQQAIRDIADPTHLDDNLKTIAARCGFSSHEVLTRTIRAYRDCTPSSLRPARTNTDQPPRP